MKSVVQFFIKLYQLTLSPDHGLVHFFRKYPTCRYYPTCSQYASQAIGKYGVLRGSIKAAKRLLRCHPWAKGGVDEA